MAIAIVTTLAPILTVARPARGDLITNGGFELGFSGWTRLEQIGSEGAFLLQSGATSPGTGTPVPVPPGGAFAAMTDAEGPGARVLYQDFVVPVGLAPYTLRFDLFLNNQATDFFAPDTLDFASPTLNQQVRVDILASTADPFSVAPADVLLNLFRTEAGDPLVSGYTTYTFDVSALTLAHAGQTLRLRFAQTDNVNFLQFGVDNVSLTVVPEPSTALLFGLGGAAIACTLAYRRRPGDEQKPGS